MECLLCCNFFSYRVLTECSHDNVCSTCLFRLRSLLNDYKCPVDRTNCRDVFIVNSIDLTYEQCSSSLWGDRSMLSLHNLDETHMYFEDEQELIRLRKLAAIVCPVCSSPIPTVAKLSAHVRRTHDRYFCELCLYNRTLFPVEHPLFTEKELDRHVKKGDDNSSFQGHVKCQLCPQYSFDSKTLYTHIREAHYFCDLCPVENRPTFSDYSDLETHYNRRHFLCMEESCKKAKHVVFTNYTELKAHYHAYHPGFRAPLNIQPSFRTEEDQVMPECLDEQPKTFRVGEFEETRIDFPALSSATPARQALDYSKLIRKPPTFTSEFTPLPQTKTKTKGQTQQKHPMHPIAYPQGQKPKKNPVSQDVPLVPNAEAFQRPPSGAWAKKTPQKPASPASIQQEEAKLPNKQLVQPDKPIESYKDIIRDNCGLLKEGFITQQEFLENYFKVVPKSRQRSDDTLSFIGVCLPNPQQAQELSDLIFAMCCQQPIDRPAEDFPALPISAVSQPKAKQTKRKKVWTSFKLGS